MSEVFPYIRAVLNWDALTAIGTLSMAVATFIVILQGRRHRRDDNRHHQDSFRPICTLTPYGGVDPWHRRDTLLSIVEQQSSNPGFGIVEINCALRNIGAGPALNVGIMFRFLDMDGYLTAVWELSPLPPGECRGAKDNPLRVPIQFGKRFNQADFSQVAGKLWEIIVIYEDVFGNHFYSVHHKRPLQLDKLHGVAGSQEFAAPSQSWITFGRERYPTSGRSGRTTN